MASVHLSVNLIVLAPAAALSAMLVIHAARKRGKINTLALVAIALPFFWGRELWAMNENMYVFQKGALTIWNVRVVGIIGWFFAVTTSLALAEGIIRKNFPRHVNGVFATLSLSGLVTMAIADIMETAAQGMGLWTPSAEGLRAFPAVFHGAQWFTPAWVSTVMLFLLPYLATSSIFRALPGLAPRWRIPGQILLNAALLLFLAFLTLVVIGPPATALLPVLCILFSFLPGVKKLRYR